MSQVISKPSTKQPVSRSVRLVKPLDSGGKNAEIQITVTRGKKTETFSYWLDRIPSDYAEAFLVEKVGDGTDLNETYHVLLDGPESSCDCQGFCWGQGKEGRTCKHLDAITTLAGKGKL